MKKLFLTLLFPLLPALSFAIGEYPMFNPGFHLSPNIGWLQAESSNPAFTAAYNSSKLGFTVGVSGDYMPKENYGISVEANLVQFDASYVELVPMGSFQSTKITNDIYFQYFQVPVSLKMMTNEFGYYRFYIKAGVVPSILTRSRSDINIESSDPSLNKSIKGKNSYNQSIPFDIGLLIAMGIEYNLSGTTNLVAGLSYHDGFLNLTREKDVTIKSRFISLDLGIKF
jgi:hypothetical protein